MTVPLPDESRSAWLAYRGESMRGTFQEVDLVRVAPVPFESLQPGDVVAFAAEGRTVVHRVAARGRNGLMTKGDGRVQADPRPLASGQLLGQVLEVERKGRRIRVAGGAAGHRRAVWLQRAFRLRHSAVLALMPAYRGLRRSRMAHRVWKPKLITVRYAVPAGGVVKQIHRGRTVARWVASEGAWWCRKPYDLILSAPET